MARTSGDKGQRMERKLIPLHEEAEVRPPAGRSLALSAVMTLVRSGRDRVPGCSRPPWRAPAGAHSSLALSLVCGHAAVAFAL